MRQHSAVLITIVLISDSIINQNILKNVCIALHDDRLQYHTQVKNSEILM